MRRSIILFLFIGMTVFSLQGQTKTLRLAVFQLEPFMMEGPVTGEVCGVTVDYWKEYIAPRMGYELEFVGLFPVMRIEKMLEAGEIDVAPLYTKIPSRESRFLYPQTHLSEIISSLIILPESPITEVTGAECLFNLYIGFLEGGYVPPLLVHPLINLELVFTEDYRQTNLNKLFAGRLDALLDINYVSLIYYLNQRNWRERVRIIMLPVEREKIYSIFRNTPEGARLRDEFDRANRQGLEDGVFEALTEKYFQ